MDIQLMNTLNTHGTIDASWTGQNVVVNFAETWTGQIRLNTLFRWATAVVVCCSTDRQTSIWCWGPLGCWVAIHVLSAILIHSAFFL